MNCLFCELPKKRIVLENEFFVVIRDGYPISKGHSLLIPKRHVSSLFDLNFDEFHLLRTTLSQSKKELDGEYHPDSYNIGINDGEQAGQTISHLHIHLIPRYIGDQEDPKGGVRWIFPEKADYWSKS